MSSVFIAFSGVIGLVVGSFLACLAYRWPRDLSILHPARSFCPACQRTLAWYENIPVLSWLVLRGRCRTCGKPISPMYPLVELVTGGVFVGLVLRFGWPAGIVFWLFAASLITIAVIDFEFLLIPDLLSLGGGLTGLLVSPLNPTLGPAPLPRMADAIFGAALGAILLYVIAILGKAAFGRYEIRLEEPVPFEVQPSGDSHRLLVGDDAFELADHLFSRSDRIRIYFLDARLDTTAFPAGQLDLTRSELRIGTKRIPIAQAEQLSGTLTRVQLPREAMGLGDLKLLAMIGAFTGWQGVLFTIPVAALLGCILGVSLMLIREGAIAAKIPFGPYLGAAALLWLFLGPEAVGLYQHWLRV
jgi:leader peptidase (prepilin peptidase) / N-methyltransferase